MFQASFIFILFIQLPHHETYNTRCRRRNRLTTSQYTISPRAAISSTLFSKSKPVSGAEIKAVDVLNPDSVRSAVRPTPLSIYLLIEYQPFIIRVHWLNVMKNTIEACQYHGTFDFLIMCNTCMVVSPRYDDGRNTG